MKKIILIRHAETDYTAQKRYCGHKHTPLNSKGIGQANCLREKLKGVRVDRIYSSDLKRALQTAKIIFPNRTVIRQKELREINFGDFVGLTWEEANKKYPYIYETWLNNPVNVKIPKGESMREFVKRVYSCFFKITDQNSGKTVTLITHGGPIRIILLRILRQRLDKFWNINQDTAAVNIIEFKKNTPLILKINDTDYLK